MDDALCFELAKLPALDTEPPTVEALRRNRANASKPFERCDHDWRVITAMVLESLPPQQYVICAVCEAVTTRRMPRDPS